jgi:HEAT repeat protein
MSEEVRNARPVGTRTEGDAQSRYREEYNDSWALVVGINNYKHLRKLNHAVSDAKAVAGVLIKDFGFKKDNVRCLLDEEATKEAIETEIDRLVDIRQEDDRLIVYFAGHGLTRTVYNGTEGYLAPVEGQVDKWSTVISAKELARKVANAWVKHAFIILDSCFSGLILSDVRSTDGGARFKRDLMTRRARIALTAGKGDQLVNDGGIGDHSIFTHFLLDGLSGQARKAGEAFITGYDLMNYVYKQVGSNAQGNQTPDLGAIEGHHQGDFVFSSTAARLPPELEEQLTGPRPTLISALTKLGERLEPRTDDMLRIQRERLGWYLTNSHEAARVQAAASLAQLADPLALEILVPVLDEGAEQFADVRQKVVVAIGQTKRPDAVNYLIQTLKSDSSKHVREAAATVLGELRSTEASEALCHALKMDEAPQVKIEAAKALKMLADPNTFESLVHALEDPDADVRSWATQALGQLKNEGAVYALSRIVLNDKNEQVRSWAAQALGQLSDVRGIAALMIELEYDNNPTVRFDAIKNLGNFQQPDFVNFLARGLKDEDAKVRRETIRVLGAMKEARSVSHLAAALDDAEADVRQAAAEALGDSRHPDAVGPLIKALSDPDVNIRRHAAQRLGTMGDLRAAEPLAKKLQDEDSKVRFIAANALGELESPEVADDLFAALGDSDTQTKHAAAIALGKLGDERALPTLVEILQDGAANGEDIRLNVLDALGLIGPSVDQPAKDLFDKLMREEENVNIRSAAALTLGATADIEYYQSLLDILNNKLEPEDVRLSAALALGILGDRRAVAELIESFKEDSPRLRLGIIWSLGLLKDQAAVVPLARFLLEDQDNAELRGNVVQSIGELGSQAAFDALLKALDSEKDENVLESVIRMLMKFDQFKINDQAVDKLIAILEQSENADVRQAAASALGCITDPGKRAVEPLMKALKDENSGVVAQAMVALGKLEAKQATEDIRVVYNANDQLQVWTAWAAGRLQDDDIVDSFVI